MERDRLVEGLILDFDGTLVELQTDYAALKPRVAAILGDEAMATGIGPALDGAALEVRARAVAEIARGEGAAVDAVRIVDGTRALFAGLAARPHVKAAIVSRNARSTIVRALERLGLGGALPRLVTIVGLDDVRLLKPAVEGGEKALAAMGVEPSPRVLVVGDTHHDLVMARALGCRAVLRRNPLLARPPSAPYDLAIDSPAELLALVDGESPLGDAR